METKVIVYFLLCCALCVVIIILIEIINKVVRKKKSLQCDLDRWNKRFQWKIGATTMLGDSVINYRLLSIDYGKNWNVVENNIIKGNVNDIYPDLLKHLEAWDNLSAYIERNGSIGSGGAINGEEMNLLNNCGFTITKKEPDTKYVIPSAERIANEMHNESDYHPNGFLKMGKWKKDMDAILEHEKNPESQTINKHPNLIKCRRIVDEFIHDAINKKKTATTEKKEIFELDSQKVAEPQEEKSEKAAFWVFTSATGYFLVHANNSLEAYIDGEKITEHLKPIIAHMPTHKCDVCGRYLKPAPAHSDGEPTFVGLLPCNHKDK